ncbi:DedA family protein [Paenibacillus sp. KQZ6P-2]|uniref:DedA family protein n=1 Tax=Paenibacillus mangrovi TaxID=2931978 RepID=A0A9X1WUG3_9BACL|nr:DedA family protein [Paenibacillus mangrovi]MCJ8014891.1 DedA family protein [Paenibacillus mangrovi]
MLHQIMDFISSIASSLVDGLGLVGIFIGMVIESACIPLPSEVIMLTGGFLVHQGKFPLWELVAVGTLGNIIGSIIVFWIGKTGARTLLEKYGKYLLINRKHLAQAESWFHNYGERAVLISRVLPFVRTFISLPAGISGMNFYKFLIYTTIGCLPWNLGLAYAGYQLGANWAIAEKLIHPVTYAVIAILAVLLIVYVWKAFRKKSKNRDNSKEI